MVRLMCLLLIVPFVAADNHANDMMNQFMQQQMMAMMAQNGWGHQDKGWGDHNNGGSANGEWWTAQNSEDHEAYLKWCEERRMQMQEQEAQRMLLKQWEEAQEKKKMEDERERHEKESKERHESMMAQWKMWEMRLNQQHEFDDLMDKFTEMKHGYMFAVTMEFLKFCECSDIDDDLERYFMHGDDHWEGDEDWDLDDLEGIDTSNAQAVAQALANRPRADQTKAFFGGLATAMCMGANQYVAQVRQWEKEFRFLDRLM